VLDAIAVEANEPGNARKLPQLPAAHLLALVAEEGHRAPVVDPPEDRLGQAHAACSGLRAAHTV